MSRRIFSKIIILGEVSVGKTCILHRFVNDKFLTTYKSTIGADFLTKEISIDGRSVTLQIWDTAGCERFNALGVAFYRGTDVCVLVYDITDRKSFTVLQQWKEEFQVTANCKEDFPFIVLGNKKDKHSERKVSEEEAFQWCKKNFSNVYFSEVSALLGGNDLIKAFEVAAQMSTGSAYRIKPHSRPKNEKPVEVYNLLESPKGLIGRGVPVPLRKIEANVTILDSFAKVELNQFYSNKEKKPIEAVYVFPLGDVTVTGFRVKIGNKILQGKLMEKTKAAQKYDDNIAKGNGAYLMNEEKKEVFSASIGNLPPGQECMITISYLVDLLTLNRDYRQFTIPTSLIVSSSSIVSPSSLSSPNIYSFSVSGDVHMSSNISKIDSPTHQDMKAEYRKEKGKFSFSGTLNLRDFAVRVKIQDSPISEVSIQKHPITEEYALIISHSPKKIKIEKIYDIQFIIDRSGSMAGKSINNAKNALQLFLRSLPMNCNFNVIGFGSSMVPLFRESRAYNKENLDLATKHVDSMQADLGGTELFAPLEFAVSSKIPSHYQRIIFVLTDGAVNDTSSVLGVASKAQGTRIFTVGVGSQVDRGLVSKLAKAGNGKHEFILNERFEKTIISLLKVAIDEPWMNSIDWGNLNVNPLSKQSILSFGGDRIKICAFVEGEIPDQATITIKSISSDGETFEEKISVLKSSTMVGDLVHQQAAKQMISQLEILRKKEELIKLSLKYSVLSKFTTFIAIEERESKTEESMELREIPVEFSVGLDAIKKISQSQNQFGDYEIEQHDIADDYFLPNAIMLNTESRQESSACCSMPSFSISSYAPSYAPSYSNPPPPSTNSNSDQNVQQQLIRLQEFDGHWEFTTELEKLFNNIKQTKPKELSLEIWTTIFCIQILEKSNKNKDELQFILEKAKKWLKNAGVEISNYESKVPI